MTTVKSRGDMTSVQEILDADRGAPAPVPFREHSTRSFDRRQIPIERYISEDYARLEHERLWSRVWQWAANEEDIPEVGDQTVYDIGNRSALIVRIGPDTFKAYHNACLHRARPFREQPGSAGTITCGFHGWSWNLDGSLREIPCRWDFPQVSDAEFGLPEVRLERWAGFIFVNFDPDAGPLADALDVVPEHFAHFPLTEKFTAAHVSKVLPVNWKTSMEAFLEAYHTVRTHPQILAVTGDANTQYDVWDTASRSYTPFGVASPHLGRLEDDEVFDHGVEFLTQRQGTAERDPDQSARTALAGQLRAMLAQAMGVDLAAAADAEVLDGVQYFVFPNWFPWAGVVNGIQYRFRPNGFDPHSSILDVRLMLPLPPAGQRPPAAPRRVLAADEPFSAVSELGNLGPIFDQDEVNLRVMQRGMQTTTRTGLVFSDYQESRIRHFHQLLDQWMENR
jgi:phenylpropionate dioxygenase-like ring-hydroxylating dioxygenase large terminal subunit